MAFTIANRSFERVSIVDDDPLVREGFSEPVEDLSVEAVLEAGPLPALNECAEQISARSQGVLCDYHLKKKGNYAVFDGDELVANLYQRKIPAVLCTNYADFNIAELRGLRKFIPSLLKPTELNPDNLADGFAICIEEFAGAFRSYRQTIRTLVRIEEVAESGKYFQVVVPAWNSQGLIRIYASAFPVAIRNTLAEGSRLYAKVNVGSRTPDDLFFSDWEMK
jgi:CheY-like chemotaxis protein